jgi:hypothetical protein
LAHHWRAGHEAEKLSGRGRAVRGKFCAGKKWSIATSAFVLAGLDPWAFSPRTRSVGIHAFDACNDVDTRDKPAQDDFTLSSTEYEHGMLEAGTSPDSPAPKEERCRSSASRI